MELSFSKHAAMLHETDTKLAIINFAQKLKVLYRGTLLKTNGTIRLVNGTGNDIKKYRSTLVHGTAHLWLVVTNFN